MAEGKWDGLSHTFPSAPNAHLQARQPHDDSAENLVRKAHISPSGLHTTSGKELPGIGEANTEDDKAGDLRREGRDEEGKRE